MLNKIIDHHVHTDFSPDCKTSMESTIARAKQLGLLGLLFTDHVDFDSPDPLFQDYIDYNVYMKKLEEVRKKNPELQFLMGVEIGYQPHIHDRLNKFLGEFPFDFVICSMHVCDKLDFYNGDFFIGKTQKESYLAYFDAVRKSVEEYDNFDVYGHLDYIIRYGPFEQKVLNYEQYKEAIDSVLLAIIEKGKGIELNTSGLRYNLGTMHPKIDILKSYKQLGGEIITLGSDAHKAEHLQADFDMGLELIKEAGFDYLAQFKNRKPSLIKIS
ncbi:histidinol-phosphatase HisJ family protein [Lottiidibacillus patelloidae]|uniref:histidinol-phosphatase HisJ family protein n=1 Tax=Lottiidibacillus patelloidae TaxID=2670334 RepID=UPI00130361F5|nr:histidinol-phosphatase HisJ family protein [Lottiidibacillus patelloidae]